MQIQLGADPEFLAINKKTMRIIDPRSLIKDVYNGDSEVASAIGIDGNGNRPTASIELRPGISNSAEVLVNRMADLLEQLAGYYNPKSIKYKAGAWYDTEPLGGHVHISWLKENTRPSLLKAMLSEYITAMDNLTSRLHYTVFSQNEINNRTAHAHRHDYGKPSDFRPGPGIEAPLVTSHLEYRYPASWLLCPELAYVFLGSAEVIGNMVFKSQLNDLPDWQGYVLTLLDNSQSTPVGMPSIAKAYKKAVRFLNKNPDPDIRDAWLGG